MIISDAKGLKEIRSENSKLKHLLARTKPEKRVMKTLAKRKFRAQQQNAGLLCSFGKFCPIKAVCAQISQASSINAGGLK